MYCLYWEKRKDGFISTVGLLVEYNTYAEEKCNKNMEKKGK